MSDSTIELLNDDQHAVAVGALLNVAQDVSVRAGLRISAAELLLFGPREGGGYYADTEPATPDAATEDVYDAIAERVTSRLLPQLLAELKGR